MGAALHDIFATRMSDDIRQDWTEDEARLLRHEAFVSRLLQQRAGDVQPQVARKPVWQRFLETSGGTALVTVLIGGIFGSIISATIQSYQSDRAFRDTWLKALGDQALVAHKEYLDKQQETVGRSFGVAGGSISAAEDLITVKSPAFNPTRYEGEAKERQIKFNQSVLDNFNTRDKQWRNERDVLGLLMNYYHPGQNEVQRDWQSLSELITEFMDCSYAWFQKNPAPIDPSEAIECLAKRKQLKAAIEKLGESLDRNRTYAWKGWQDPKQIAIGSGNRE